MSTAPGSLLYFFGHDHPAAGLLLIGTIAAAILLLSSLAIRRATKQLLAYDFNQPAFATPDDAWRWGKARNAITLKINTLRLVNLPLIVIVAFSLGIGTAKL
jgi:hypothetical protein